MRLYPLTANVIIRKPDTDDRRKKTLTEGEEETIGDPNQTILAVEQ